MDSSTPMPIEGFVYYYIGHQSPDCRKRVCKREFVSPLLERLQTVTFHFADYEEVKNTLLKVLQYSWFPCVIQVNPDGQVLLSQGKLPLVDHVKVYGAEICPRSGLYLKTNAFPAMTPAALRDWAQKLTTPDSLDELVEKMADIDMSGEIIIRQ